MNIFGKNEIISKSFNKIKKEKDLITVNVKAGDKNIDIKLAGKAIWAATFVAIAPAAICALGATVVVCAITKTISRRRKENKELT